MGYRTNSKFWIEKSAISVNTPKANILNNSMISLNEIIESIIAGSAAADNSKVFLQTTAPTVGESTVGDVYINTDSGRVYQFDGAWTSKYNPAVITQNKSYAYSTYNKAETFTTGNTTTTKTSGTDNLSIGTGDLGSGDVAYLRYNETGVATHFTAISVKDGQAATFSTDDITDHYTAAVAMPSAYNISYVDAGDATKAASITISDSSVDVITNGLTINKVTDGNKQKTITIDATTVSMTSSADNTLATASLIVGDTWVTMVWDDMVDNNNDASVTVQNAGTYIAGKTVDITTPIIKVKTLPSYQDNAAALGASLREGTLYRTTGTGAAPLNVAGIVMVVV